MSSPTYDYNVAKNVLSETEKDRILACFLNITDANAINYQKAAADFGSASVDSFKKMITTGFKKVEKAMAGGGATAPPPSSAKAKGGKKRKAATEEEGGEGEDVDATPKPKARKEKKGKRVTPEADGENGEAVVKAEDGEGA